jgi:hypothetical protein
MRIMARGLATSTMEEAKLSNRALKVGGISD